MVTENEASTYKEEGNVAFNNGDWEKAINLYSKAINSLNDSSRDMAVFYKNRAAAFLKLNKFEEALHDCDKSLNIAPTDPKALFRRCQSLENLERYEEAYRDARQLLIVNPENKLVQPTLERLFQITQERARQNALVTTKVENMIKIAFDLTSELEKREKAFNNLLVLSRERSGSELMLMSGCALQIKRLLKVEKNRNIFISSIRIIGELCKHGPEKALLVLKDVGIPWFLEIIDSTCEKQVNAAQYCLQVILNAFSGMENKPDAKPIKEICEKYKNEIDTILTCLTCAFNNRVISGLARDSIIELVMRNIHYTYLSWAEQLVEIGGVERLMEVTSELEDCKYESSMNTTPSTQTIAAVCLARIHENMYYDAAKDNFMAKIRNFIQDKLMTSDIESKVRVVVAITALLLGPLDVGNAIIGKEGIMEMILVMANTDDVLQQKVASECIIAAASKKDKAKAIISQGIEILKKLYSSKNDNIRVRALVGLCKLGSSGGNDASIKPFAEGSNLKLAEACRRFLLHPGNDQDLKKWSAEGLSYLTLDAEVKEKLVEDHPALQALIELAKSGNQSVLYGVVTTLVNLCNAYEKQEIQPELVELAKFAKHHIPEEHTLDDPDFISKRIVILGKVGVTTALVALSKTESPNSKELISRVFNSLCGEQELRGTVVQQGGSKVLLPLALNGTDMGKRQASQALARIAITMNPEVAFPGQRVLEVIRPLISLLNQEYTALENFEALMGLCNIASLNETSRQRILKEGGLSKVDHYLYEDHELLCRAASQCTCNLTLSPDVVKVYEGDNDKMKFMVALMLDEDLDTCLAASGAVAILTSNSNRCCEKIFDSKSWEEALKYLLSHQNSNAQYRGVSILKTVLDSSKETAEKIIATDLLEVLMAVTKLGGNDKAKIRELAEESLKIGEKYGIIKKPDSINPFELASQEEEVN